MIPQTAGRVLTRRPFSLMGSLRTAWRSFESHPFERLPASQKSAPADWGRQVRRISSQASIFFPGMALMLGWPLIAKQALNHGASYEMQQPLRLEYE